MEYIKKQHPLRMGRNYVTHFVEFGNLWMNYLFGFSREADYWKGCYSRGILPAPQALAVEAVVTQSGEDTVHRLVHTLQTHRALRQLCEVHHW